VLAGCGRFAQIASGKNDRYGPPQKASSFEAMRPAVA